jgi:hypothetical protein
MYALKYRVSNEKILYIPMNPRNKFKGSYMFGGLGLYLV